MFKMEFKTPLNNYEIWSYVDVSNFYVLSRGVDILQTFPKSYFRII